MGHHRSWGSTGERQSPAVVWHRVSCLGVCLVLLISACTPIPVPSTFTPAATGPALPATITAYHGQIGTIFAVAWSPDDMRIASGSNDGTVQVWDARTGHRLVVYRGHTGTVYTVAWSPDGLRIASDGNDSTVQVWDANSEQRLLTYHGHSSSERGRLVARWDASSLSQPGHNGAGVGHQQRASPADQSRSKRSSVDGGLVAEWEVHCIRHRQYQ